MTTLTLPDGRPVSVNPSRIAYVQPSDASTLIVFDKGFSLIVREGFLEAMTILEGHTP
jgi:hypothetical protein